MADQLKMHKSLAIRQLHAQGMSERQVAEALGVSRGAVRRHLAAPAANSTKAPTGEVPISAPAPRSPFTRPPPEWASWSECSPTLPRHLCCTWPGTRAKTPTPTALPLTTSWSEIAPNNQAKYLHPPSHRRPQPHRYRPDRPTASPGPIPTPAPTPPIMTQTFGRSNFTNTAPKPPANKNGNRPRVTVASCHRLR